MEKKRTRSIISQPRFHNRRQKDIYFTEKKTKVNITATFIADKVLKKVMKKLNPGEKIQTELMKKKFQNKN